MTHGYVGVRACYTCTEIPPVHVFQCDLRGVPSSSSGGCDGLGFWELFTFPFIALTLWSKLPSPINTFWTPCQCNNNFRLNDTLGASKLHSQQQNVACCAGIHCTEILSCLSCWKVQHVFLGYQEFLLFLLLSYTPQKRDYTSRAPVVISEESVEKLPILHLINRWTDPCNNVIILHFTFIGY